VVDCGNVVERIMARTSEIFSTADRQRVADAIRDAEAATSAEIVPVVARVSGRYDRPEDIVGLWGAGLALAVVWLVFPLPRAVAGDWAVAAPAWQLVALLTGTFFGFLAGALAGSCFDPLRRLFTPRRQMREEVSARARQVFFDQRVHHTAGGSGVLLYVSLFERMAVVMLDQGILERLGPGRVEEICQAFTQRLRASTPIDALCDTARSLGQQLAPLLPRADDDVNELADALVVLS
jgi:putative membrane protein